MTEFF